MIIAIDETGTFQAGSQERHFFAAIHLRQRRTLYKLKERQFEAWETSLPRSLKNAKGEIKSSRLSDDQLEDFARKVMCSEDIGIGVTPFCVKPADNPEAVVEKHRAVALIGISEGVKGYKALGRNHMARACEEFGNWAKRLSYNQFLKVKILGSCLAGALVNSVGHAISGGYDEELLRIRFLIDQDFIKEPRHQSFWRQILRNQLWDATRSNPIPLLKSWKKKGHPFVTKYERNGRLDLSELFNKNLGFGLSHKHFEIRIADAVNTILSRRFNQSRCLPGYRLLRQCFLSDGKVQQRKLRDFDLEAYRYDPDANPWGKFPSESVTGESEADGET